MEAPAIVQDGFLLRARTGVTGWLCRSCMHHMTDLQTPGVCANCKVAGALHEIKSPERLHDETETMKDRQRFHYWQEESFNPQSWESQMGRALTSQQVLLLIQKWIPGAKMFPQLNPFLGKTLMAFYVPNQHSAAEKTIVSPTEAKADLKFVCCGEVGIMPEWDVLPLDADRKSLPQIRGWRSILGIFYRSGYIPFIPDEGTRFGWWQIKESPYRRN